MNTNKIMVGFIIGLAAIGISTISVLAAGTSVCVNPGGSGGCYASIQAAVNAVSEGGIVTVGPGTFKEDVIIQKALILQGSGAQSTIIDATGLNNSLVIKGVSAPTVISGFTVENANLEGILLQNSANVTIENNTVKSNDKNLVPSFPTPSCPGALPLEQEDCGEGIHLLGVTNSTIKHNIVENNDGGILLTDETGPTHDNTIMDNIVDNNTFDCGITLASHAFNFGSPIAANKGGVYNNKVIDNIAEDNGAAGAGAFAAPPGASAYDNIFVHNTFRRNGFPGIAIHSHSPFQNVNGNVLVNNIISENAADPEEGPIAHPTGISVISDIVPINTVTIAANKISDEYYGIFATNVTEINGLNSNKYAPSVTTPVQWSDT